MQETPDMSQQAQATNLLLWDLFLQRRFQIGGCAQSTSCTLKASAER